MSKAQATYFVKLFAEVDYNLCGHCGWSYFQWALLPGQCRSRVPTKGDYDARSWHGDELFHKHAIAISRPYKTQQAAKKEASTIAARLGCELVPIEQLPKKKPKNNPEPS